MEPPILITLSQLVLENPGTVKLYIFTPCNDLRCSANGNDLRIGTTSKRTQGRVTMVSASLNIFRNAGFFKGRVAVFSLMLFLFTPARNDLPSLKHRAMQRMAYSQERPIENQAIHSVIREPASMSLTYRYRRGDNVRVRPFSQPDILTFTSRRHNSSTQHYDVFIYSQGLAIGKLNRGFDPVGCVIGSTVYPISGFTRDVGWCVVTRIPSEHDVVTFLILKGDAVKRALTYREMAYAENATLRLERGALLPTSRSLDLQALDEEVRNSVLELGAMTVRSDHQWSSIPVDPVLVSDIPTTPRYEVCIVTCIKPFADMLPHWIDYHLRLGVDKVFIFDNDSPADIRKIVSDFPQVETIHWPWERTQVSAFSYALHQSRTRCRWLMSFDVDEYIEIGLDDRPIVKMGDMTDVRPLKRHVRRLERGGFTQHKIPFILMTTPYKPDRSSDPVPQQFVHLNQFQRRTQGKSICFTDMHYSRSSIHMSVMRRGAGEMQRLYDDRSTFEPKVANDTVNLVHYVLRPWNDVREKFKFGNAGILIYRNFRTELSEEPPRKPRDLGQKWVFFKNSYQRVVEEWKMGMQSLVWEGSSGKSKILVRDSTEGVYDMIFDLK